MNHPAKFSPAIIEEARKVLDSYDFSGNILDPFAGVGGVHDLSSIPLGRWTHGVELEPEWAAAHWHTQVGDATMLTYLGGSFDAVVTSPPYGNRMADSYAGDAKGSKRVTYRIALGHELTEGSGAGMQWGRSYRETMGDALDEIERVLKPGGLFLLNISNHIRKGEEQRVSEWYLSECCEKRQFRLLDDIHIDTPRMGFGQHAELRVDYEHLYVMEKL